MDGLRALVRLSARARRAGLAAVLAAAALAGCALPGLPPGPGAPARPAAAKLTGSSWYWLGTLTPAGLIGPADPGAFNVEFLDGGQLAVQLDCNTGGASWSQSATSLSIGPLKATRKACSRASEADRFGRQLSMVRSAQMTNGMLELALGEAGTMVLARDPDWKLRSFDCPAGVAPLLVAFGRDEALLRWKGDSWRMARQPSGSGTRYGSGGTLLFSQGDQATLVSDGRQVAGPCVARR